MIRKKIIVGQRQRKKRINRPEQGLQIAIFNDLIPLMRRQKYKQFMAFHVPNGGKRTKYEAHIFQAMGVMSGVADIILLLPAGWSAEGDVSVNFGEPRTVFIELKAGSGGQEDSQEAFEGRVTALGFSYHLLVAKNPADAVTQMRHLLRQYGVPL